MRTPKARSCKALGVLTACRRITSSDSGFMNAEDFYKLYDSSKSFRASLGSYSVRAEDIKYAKTLVAGKRLKLLAKDQGSDIALVMSELIESFSFYDIWENRQLNSGPLSRLLCEIQLNELIDLTYVYGYAASRDEELAIVHSLEHYWFSDSSLQKQSFSLDNLSEMVPFEKIHDVCAILSTSKSRTIFVAELVKSGRLSRNESATIVHPVVLENAIRSL